MSRNPFAFGVPQVTVTLVIVLLITLVPLLYVHLVVPPTPSTPYPEDGLNLTRAWLDLQELSNGFHPYNSRRNDEIHHWLLVQIKAVLKENGARIVSDYRTLEHENDAILVEDDTVSNLTYSSGSLSVYFEGSNVIVHIPGTEQSVRGNVLVNAHYDSVSTGYGVTDDGMGVITILQLVSYFSKHRPKRGIVFLLNNGEEDFLNGAYAFTRHPISQTTRMFLNLEGAGSGGRAVLFRSTDAQVTRFYKHSPHPFGSVFTQDGFERGVIRSQTDYVVFNGVLGLRGLDVSFFEPRARYHTIEDATKFDSLSSLWQMLSNALATTKAMSSNTDTSFDGRKRKDGFVNSGRGSRAVWFDLFGRVFACFELHTIFAISVSLLVTTPVFLMLLTVLLMRMDRWYPFSASYVAELDESAKTVDINGWRGFFRYPLVAAFSTASLIGLSFLLAKVNPYIIYSSEYAVWALMFSAWACFEWIGLYGIYHHRPTVLGRFYALLWSYVVSYILLVGATVLEHDVHVAGTYFIVVHLGSVFLALLVSYLELLLLPPKSAWLQTVSNQRQYDSPSSEPSSRPPTAGNGGEVEEHDDVTERTSLLRGGQGTGYNTYHARRRALRENSADRSFSSGDDFDDDQSWGKTLPGWTWILQLLLVVPINVILAGQIGLLFTTGTHQTPADGNPVLMIYSIISILTVLMLSTLRPFLHKLSYRVWWLLAVLFVGTLLYTLLAFPFSLSNRLKVDFVQRVNLDDGTNKVSLLGVEGFLKPIIEQLPSASGQSVDCIPPSISSRSGLSECKWSGLHPNVLSHDDPSGLRDWINYTATTAVQSTSVTFNISARNSKSCRLLFDTPVEDFNVSGSAVDDRFRHVSKAGAKEIRLWHRDFGRSWEVTARWSNLQGKVVPANKIGLNGHVVCIWSDANMPGMVPALDEIWRFAPAWSTVTKAADGLVEGSKAFSL